MPIQAVVVRANLTTDQSRPRSADFQSNPTRNCAIEPLFVPTISQRFKYHLATRQILSSLPGLVVLKTFGPTHKWVGWAIVECPCGTKGGWIGNLSGIGLKTCGKAD
jgi:hypothetical protein